MIQVKGDNVTIDQALTSMYAKVEVLANDVAWIKRIGVWIAGAVVTDVGLRLLAIFGGGG